MGDAETLLPVVDLRSVGGFAKSHHPTKLSDPLLLPCSSPPGRKLQSQSFDFSIVLLH